MILFKSDWKKYPTAVIDYNTNNETFLRLVHLYKSMGIDNCEFILALYQPELSGIDPHDPDLDQETKAKILAESQYNPWYYFREVHRVPPSSGSVPAKFRANRGNIAMFWSFFNHIDFALLQPRQTGKSISADTLNTGITNLWATNADLTLITKDTQLRVRNIERLKTMRSLLPDYVYYPDPNDSNNTETITNMRRNNRLKTAVGRNDRVAADKLGRGLTAPILLFDEIAYISMIAISLPVALSSASAARDEAAANGQMYGNIYTTTAGSINDRDGKYAHKLLTGGIPWSETFFDLRDQKELVKVVEKGSSNDDGCKPLIYGAFNHRQLGYTDEWLYRKIRESASGPELTDRDYMNIWTTGTEGSPLTPTQKADIKSSEIDPKHIQITESGYTLRWYVEENEVASRMSQGHYVLGSDPSEGLGGKNDAIGFVLIDVVTHDLVCAAKFNETNLTTLAQFIADFLIKYENVTFIPERRSSGTGILDTIFIHLQMAGVDPFRRIFNLIANEPETYKTEYDDIRRHPVSSRPVHFYDRYKRYFGFATSGSGQFSRETLYGACLSSAVGYGGKRVYDRTLSNEILSLTIRNSRIDHSQGNHDDMVISWLLAHWLLIKGKNLAYYGIRANMIFQRHKVSAERMDAYEVFEQERREQYILEFNALMEQLPTLTDRMMVNKAELRLKWLSGKFDVMEMSGVGIDALLQHAKDERDRKSRMHDDSFYKSRYTPPTPNYPGFNQPKVSNDVMNGFFNRMR